MRPKSAMYTSKQEMRHPILFTWKCSGADPGFFFRRGCTCLLLYFNTNKPHSFFFLQNTSCIRKPQVISGGRGVCTPCTLPLDPPLHGSVPPGTNSFLLALPMPHRKNDKCYPVSKASLMKPLRLSKVRI